MNRFVKAFAALLAVISFWCSIPAIPVMAAEYSLSATTYFRDANFRNYLKQFDTDGNGSLSSTEIANIKVVDLRNAGVTNTKGIYYLTAIEELYISGSPTEPNSGGQPMEFHCENFPKLRILDVRGLSKNWGFYITGCDNLKFIYSDGNINIWGNSAAPDTVNATYVNAVIFAVNANNPNAHYESTGVYKRYWYTNPNNPSQILIDIKYTSQGTGFKIGQSFPTAAQLPGFSTTPNTPTPRVTNTTAPRPTNTNTPRVTATNTPKPTNTNTPKPTNTNTPKPTNTNTPKPTNTNTPKPTNTNTPKPTNTNTPRPTNTNTPRPTNTNTPRPTNTNTPRPTNTNTPRPTNTNTPRPTNTNTPRPTNTNTPRPTNTNTPRPTNTNTPRPTATNTPRPSTPTPTPQGVVNMKLTNWGTNSQISLTGTNLPNTSDVIVKFSVDGGTNLAPNIWTPNDISASVSGNIVTLTIKKSALASGVTFQLGSSTTMGQFRVISASQAANILKVTTTGTTTAIVSATPTPRVTATSTPRPTATPKPTATNTPRPTATPKPTATNTPRPTATPKPTATNTPRPTATPKPTATNTPRPTATNTPRPTATNTPRPTATNTPKPSTPTPTPQGVVNMKLTNWGTNSQITLTGTNLPNTSDVIVKFSVDGGTNLRPNIWTPNDISASVSGNIVTLTIKKSALVNGVTFQLGSSTTMGQFRVISASQAANILKVTTTGTTTAIVSATPTPRVTATSTPRPTATPKPTATSTPRPTATPKPTATNTPRPTTRPTNTSTPRPTATNTPRPTNRPTSTSTPRPTATNTPRPTTRPVTTLPPFDPNLSGAGVGGFVDRIYQVVLNRAVPSTPGGGKDYWMGELTSGRRNGGQVATIFLTSEEFTSKGYTDEQFVEVLYRLFFNRSMGSNLSNNYWVLELKNNRRTRQNIIAEFINSQEWANTCYTYGIVSGGSCRPNITITPSADIVAFVTRFYTEGLKKDAPASAVNYWAGELSGGTKTAREVAVAFLLGSDLTSQRTSNTEFSIRVYKTLLGRAPTTDELRAATAICRSSTTGAGNGRTDLVNMIINSNEFAAICARLGIRYGGTGNPAAAKISVPDVDSAAYELEILEIEAEDEALILEANEDAVPYEAEAVTEEVIEIEEEILEEEVIEEEVFEETSEAVEDVETEIVEDVIEA